MTDHDFVLRIVFIEDNEHDRLAFRRAFQKSDVPFELTEFSRGEKAVEFLHTHIGEFDIAVFDHDLPGAAGLDHCKNLLAGGFKFPIVILTGNGSEQLAVEALKAGVDDYLVKDPAQGYLALLPIVLMDVVKKHEERLARRRAEKALMQSEKRYHTLFEAAGDAILIHDMEGRVLDANKTACERLMYEHHELIGKGCHEIEAPEYAHSMPGRMKELTQKGHLIFETQHLRSDNSSIPIEISCRKIEFEHQDAILCIARDISERKRLEEQRRKLFEQMEQAQKIQSLGTLAGGIAHNYNNQLQSIIGNLELALDEINEASPTTALIRNALSAADSGAMITRQMLAYSGKGRVVVSEVDINLTFNDIRHLIQAAVPDNITIESRLAKELPPIKVDESQIQQLIMNLTTNAMEAIDKDAGRIVIKTNLKKYDREFFKNTCFPNNLSDGWHVRLEVSDNGCGMDAQTQEKMFDPFFTTKFTGRGLGLAAVLGIVRGNNGAIKVASKPGEGSSFKIYFPV